ncbi:MAG TPA: DUF424 family protein [Methanocorpusculum sp.]|nr:DUF424 family protein [Methanocorpusculum sp.]
MYLKVHKIPGCESVTAVCDAELLGKTLSNDLCEITIDESFYGNELATDEEVLNALELSTNSNIIGKKVCRIAIDAGLIEEESCIIIEGIPHAQIYGV